LDPTYVCPMHAEITSKEEGASCPICGMDLVAVKQSNVSDEDEGKHPVVEVSPGIINSLGVRTVKLERRDISRRVETPGFVQQIKKGKMSTYRAPFDGVVSELLYEPERWYEEAGIPLISLSSDELLAAQKEHLTIFAETALQEQQTLENDDAESETKQAQTDAQVEEQAAAPIAAPTDNYLDADGKLLPEYREKFFAMGHNEESIAEIEKEMQKTLGLPAKNDSVEDEAEQQTEIEKTASSKNQDTINTGKTGDTDDETTEEKLTLEESRKKLRSLGMRNEDILQLEDTGNATDTLILYSNGEGRVMQMRHDKGYTTRSGEQLFKFGGQVRAVVVANAFQRDAAWITTGQKVEVRMPHNRGTVWPGIVNSGAISINPDSQNIGIRLTFTAPLDKVRSNMYVVGTIFGDTRKDVIAVPTQSIIRTEGEDRVVVALGDGRFRPVTVKLGVEAGGQTEIVEGLEEGDEVVVMAHFLIDSESSLQASLQRLNSSQ